MGQFTRGVAFHPNDSLCKTFGPTPEDYPAWIMAPGVLYGEFSVSNVLDLHFGVQFH